METRLPPYYFFMEEAVMPSLAAPIALDIRETETFTEDVSLANAWEKSPGQDSNRPLRQ